MKLNSLSCADDLIILSRSKVGLENCVNTFSSYFNYLMLKMNPKKNRNIVFRNCEKKGTQASTFAIKNRHCPKLHLPRNLNLSLWKLNALTRPSTTEGPPCPLYSWDDTLISKVWNLHLHAVVKSGVPLFSRTSNPGTTLQSLIYNAFKTH